MPANWGLPANGGVNSYPKAEVRQPHQLIRPVLARLARWLGFGAPAPQGEQQMPDKRRWTFRWSEEELARTATLPIEEWAAYLSGSAFAQEYGLRGLTRRLLVSEYAYWIEATETRPLSWPVFDRSLRRVGIRKVRLMRGGVREYRYIIPPARPKLVARTDLAASELGERNAA